MSNFIDLQVNGYAGVDFNGNGLTVEACHTVCDALDADGVEGILPTVITDTLEAMEHRLAAIASACEQSERVRDRFVGIHIEGPFLNEAPGYIGAHPVDAARPAEIDAMKRLLGAAGGLTRIVTLAPERDPEMATTRFLADQGIVVAAGHCDSTLDELQAAIDAGLTMFTHLGNGCPQTMHRHDNIVQRALSLAGKLTISFIADGAHVPLFAFQNYLDAAGIENVVIVTDAISAAGLGPGTYSLGDQQIEIGEDLIPWSSDRTHFVGSATTMPRMEANLRSMGLGDAEIQHLLANGPRAILAR